MFPSCAYLRRAIAGEALHRGAAEFIGKPVSLEDLCDRVAHYCEDPA